ncbi:MAG: hypothetical protein ACRDR6_14820 [Pseudonocardiaceae bacterium]
MPTRSTPLYLGDELRAQAERAAEAAGLSLSAWVREAIEARLGHDTKIAAGLAAVREFERDRGPIPPELDALARRELEDAGVIPRLSA